MLDPAIVGGQLSSPAPASVPTNKSRSESPSGWIRSNLEQLTAESSPNSMLPMLAGFSGMSLNGSNGNNARMMQQHGWGAPSMMTSGPPPPGFSAMAMAAARAGPPQQQHMFPPAASDVPDASKKRPILDYLDKYLN